MEVFTNNKDVLYDRLNQVINVVAKEKPFGDLMSHDILEVLSKLRDDFLVNFAKQELAQDILEGKVILM